MGSPIDVRVFTSCPGDVVEQKNTVERLCKGWNQPPSNVRFTFINWKDHIGQVGIRNQEQINTFIGDYDIYIGIFWKRFGTKTGGVNLETGQDFESGTEEEFTIAKENWERTKKPDIYLFFKTGQRIANTATEAAQLTKLLEFLELHKKSNYSFVNEFADDGEFMEKINSILIKRALKYSEEVKKSEKIEIVDNGVVNLPSVSAQINGLPAYIPRPLLEFESITKYPNLDNVDNKSDLITLLKTIGRIVLLGDAGSGKTTELQHLAYQLNRRDSGYFEGVK